MNFKLFTQKKAMAFGGGVLISQQCPSGAVVIFGEKCLSGVVNYFLKSSHDPLRRSAQ